MGYLKQKKGHIGLQWTISRTENDLIGMKVHALKS